MLWLRIYVVILCMASVWAYTEGVFLAFCMIYGIELVFSMDNIVILMQVRQSFGLTLAQTRLVLWGGAVVAVLFRYATITAGLYLIAFSPYVESVLGMCLMLLPYITRGKRRAKIHSLVKAILLIEATDIILAIDAIIASVAVSRNNCLLMVANTLALLSVRWSALRMQASNRDRLTRYALPLIRFLGIKLIISPWYTLSPLSTFIGACIVVVSVTFFKSDC